MTRLFGNFRRAALGWAVLLAAGGCDVGRNQLLADLQSPAPDRRAVAVRKLAAQNRPEDLVLFTRAAKDVSFLVREEAAAALGKSQDARVVDLLGELLEDPDEAVQMKAALALADTKSDKAKAYLTLQYARRGRSTRMAIVQALKTAQVPSGMAMVVNAEAKTLWERNLQALAQGTAAERVGAAEELGKSGRPEAVAKLEALIKDGSVLLAAAAVRGLGYAGDRRVAPTIAELLGDSAPDLRDAAIASLKRLQEPKTAAPLVALAVDKGPAGTAALEALLAFPRAAGTDEALCTVATEAPEAVALEAARAMRERGGCPLALLERKLSRASKLLKGKDRVTPDTLAQGLVAARGLGGTARGASAWVLPLLQEKDAHLRQLALEAAGELGDAAAVGAVEKAFAQELEAVKPLRADWVPAPLPHAYSSDFAPTPGTPAARTAELLEKAQALQDARLRGAGKRAPVSGPPTDLVDDVAEEQLSGLAAAALALGQLQAPSALQALEPLAADPAPSVRAAALAGLASLGPRGFTLAQAGLWDGDRDVQGATAAALARLGDPGIGALLDAAAKLTGDRVRLLESLAGRPLPPSASRPLIQLLQQGGGEAAVAAELLGALKAHDAVDALLSVLDDPSSVSHRAALHALGEIGDSRVAVAVARDLWSDSPEVRAAAAGALTRVGTAAQVEALDALRGDYYLLVRESSARALAKLAPTGDSR